MLFHKAKFIKIEAKTKENHHLALNQYRNHTDRNYFEFKTQKFNCPYIVIYTLQTKK